MDWQFPPSRTVFAVNSLKVNANGSAVSIALVIPNIIEDRILWYYYLPLWY